MRRKNNLEHPHRRQSKAAQIAKREWPSFLFDVEEANPQFVEEVKKAVRAFSFEELDSGGQCLFRIVKKHGAHAATRTLHAALEQIRREDANAKHTGAELMLVYSPGHYILNKIPEAVRRNLLPYNNVQFFPINDSIVVHCCSLIQERQGSETLFHSRHKPTLDVDGRRLVVAFTRHAIIQIMKRINPRCMSYLALGDVFAFLNDCVYFEKCKIRNCRTGEFDHLAVSFFDTCGSTIFYHWSAYVKGMLGTYDADKGQPFYRVGYCPAFPDGGFLKLGTFLVPGYRDTPEYAKLMDSALSAEEKHRLAALAISENAANHTVIGETNISALKWFHANGVPQVVQTKDKFYEPHRSTFVISEVIEK